MLGQLFGKFIVGDYEEIPLIQPANLGTLSEEFTPERYLTIRTIEPPVGVNGGSIEEVAKALTQKKYSFLKIDKSKPFRKENRKTLVNCTPPFMPTRKNLVDLALDNAYRAINNHCYIPHSARREWADKTYILRVCKKIMENEEDISLCEVLLGREKLTPEFLYGYFENLWGKTVPLFAEDGRKIGSKIVGGTLWKRFGYRCTGKK